MRAPKFTHSPAEMIRCLRSAREFSHLRGRFIEAFMYVSDTAHWPSPDRCAYEAALPALLVREGSNLITEAAISRGGLIFPAAIIRRMAFLYGVQCVACGLVTGGYQPLPISANGGGIPVSDELLRAPFIATLGNVIEPLCPRCRRSFAVWCGRFMGDAPDAERIELCATGWLAETVKRKAGASVYSYEPRKDMSPHRARRAWRDAAVKVA